MDSIEGSFEIRLAGQDLCIQGQGFWSVEVSHAFARDSIEALRRVPPSTKVIFDVRELKTLRDEGQMSFLQVFRMLGVEKFREVEVFVSSPLTRLQLVRLVSEGKVARLVRFA